MRTRLAPSPTGFVHIGTLRTALYCYLLAKKHDGTFYLRLEDTDQSREVMGSLDNLLHSLRWSGINPTEGLILEDDIVRERGDYGPYIQSKRLPIYHKYAQQLLDNGHAYHCFCSAERLANMRQEQVKNKRPPMYDRRCMHLSEEEVKRLINSGEPYVIRQKIPQKRIVELQDIVRGKVKFDCSTLDDQVLIKSDGFPTYHLAHVVDDYLMETNPVIRGEEWLPSVPKHLLLFEALGWEPPPYAHLPLLLNKDKTKLSKRQGDVAVEDYIKKGYLKEALINFVVFLGWNPGVEQELFTMEELIERFSLQRVHKAGAVFDIEKLNWFNGLYIRKLPELELLEKVKPYLVDAGIAISNYSEEFLLNCLNLAKDRLRYLAEAPSLMDFYFSKPVFNDEELILNQKMKVTKEIAIQGLTETITLLGVIDDFSVENLKNVLIDMIQRINLKNGQVLWPMRVALTGVQFSPGAFEVASCLGKEETMTRLKLTLLYLEENKL